MTDQLRTNPLTTLETRRRTKAWGQGAVCLVVSHGDHSRVVRLHEGQSVVLGRDPSADVSIVDDSVSRRHARFEFVNGRVMVTDLGSTNGTKLNGEVVQHAEVRVGDEASAGTVSVAVHLVSPLGRRRHGFKTHDQFAALLDDEVERATLFRRPFGVVFLKASAGTAKALATKLRGGLRSVDRVAEYADDVFELLLPEIDPAGAATLVRALLGEPRDVLAGAAFWPSDGVTAETLLEAARGALHAATAQAPWQVAAEQEHRLPLGPVVVSEAMRAVFDTLGRVADAVIPVLVVGETGTGKEILARAIHERGPRQKGRFAAINCSAIPATLIESVLFGHERGAFTGATQSARGVFEEANGGTVFLDEVGELTLAAQAALLRVLETKEIRRVGGTQEIKLDVRVIAATHRDLEAMVAAKTFREDLLYRLNAMTIEVPPLRARPEEIGPLTERFLALANTANGRQVTGVDPEVTQLFLQYPWPGNIRELRNAVERAVIVTRGLVIGPGDLPQRIRTHAAQLLDEDETPHRDTLEFERTGDLRLDVQRFEVQVILDALRKAKGNRTEAARRLHVPVRTLSHKLRQLGIKKLGFGLEDDDAE